MQSSKGVNNANSLSNVELAALLFAAKRHYDGAVKAAANVGGKFHGWANMMEDQAVIFLTLSADDLQLIAKTCEIAHYATRAGLSQTQGDILSGLWSDAQVYLRLIQSRWEMLNQSVDNNTVL